MRHALIILAAAASIVLQLSSCEIQTASDLGKNTTKTMNVAPFAVIQTAGNIDVHFVQSEKYEVSIVAPEKIMPEVSVRSKDGALIIENTNEDNILFNGRKFGKAQVWVNAPFLTSVWLLGTGNFDVKGQLIVPELTISEGGTGSISLDSIRCTGLLQIASEGTGDIHLGKSVSAQKITLRIEGTGIISGDIADTKDVELTLNGIGDIFLNLKNVGNVTGNNDGTGDITLSGSAKSCKVSNTGIGNVTDNTMH